MTSSHPVLLVVLLLLLVSALFITDCQATTTTTSTELYSQSTTNHKVCETDCDCNKNSDAYEVQFMSTCFGCFNKSCEVIAKCKDSGNATPLLCTLDPSSRSLNFVCLDTQKDILSTTTTIGSSIGRKKSDGDNNNRADIFKCRDDFDCSYSYHHNRTDQIYTLSGYCLPNNLCKYQMYSVMDADEYSVKPFNHNTCSGEARRCVSREDCFNLKAPKISSTLQSPDLDCNIITGRCEEIEEEEDSNNNKGELECETEEDCYNNNKNPNACYACTLASNTNISSNKTSSQHLAATRKICVDTSNGQCSSGMCQQGGKCIIKHCKHHGDCLSIAGITRNCHRCDENKGICVVNQLCKDGEFCILDFANNRKCSNLINTCKVGGNNEHTLIQQIDRNYYCIPLGAGDTGYYRNGDFSTAVTDTTTITTNKPTIDANNYESFMHVMKLGASGFFNFVTSGEHSGSNNILFAREEYLVRSHYGVLNTTAAATTKEELKANKDSSLIPTKEETTPIVNEDNVIAAPVITPQKSVQIINEDSSSGSATFVENVINQGGSGGSRTGSKTRFNKKGGQKPSTNGGVTTDKIDHKDPVAVVNTIDNNKGGKDRNIKIEKISFDIEKTDTYDDQQSGSTNTYSQNNLILEDNDDDYYDTYDITDTPVNLGPTNVLSSDLSITQLVGIFIGVVMFILCIAVILCCRKYYNAINTSDAFSDDNSVSYFKSREVDINSDNNSTSVDDINDASDGSLLDQTDANPFTKLINKLRKKKKSSSNDHDSGDSKDKSKSHKRKRKQVIK